ncbi:MAG: outer membrane protein transport protein, partial [Myxococcaceae bacterium]
MSRPLRLAALLTAAASCTPAIPGDEPPVQVIALFDPGAEVPVVPAPNDLALDPDTGLLAVPDGPGQSEADRLLNRYLRTLDGFPAEASASTTFSAALDPASVTVKAVRVLDLTDPAAVLLVPTSAQLARCQSACAADVNPTACTAGCPEKIAVKVAYDAPRRRVKVSASFERDRVYAVALLGGQDGLRGASGEEVVGAPAFVFLRARKSLATCADLSSEDCRAVTALMHGDSPEEERAGVVALERARRELKPALDQLELQALSREQLVAAWSFRTVRQALVTFDPANKVVPFPNDLLMLSGKVNLPPDPADDATSAALKAQLNQLDGFSTSASLITESGPNAGAADSRLDAKSLTPSQFKLVNLDTPELLPVNCRACGSAALPPGAEPDQVALKPDKPLRSHTRYALLWLKGARTLDGRTLNTNTLFALTRLPTPLYANSRSATDSLDDLTASLLEPLRLALQPALEAGDGLGIPREDVLLAFTFTTQTTSESLPALGALPADWNLPTGMTGGPARMIQLDTALLAFLSATVGQDLNSQIRWVKEGEFTSANALDPNGTEIDLSAPGMPTLPTDGAFTEATLATPKLEQRRFLLVVPARAKDTVTGRIPVVIFHHGLGESRRDAVAIANTIARAGYATLAIDAPFHGLRSYCQSNTDCRGGSLCAFHRCPDALETLTDGYVIRQLAGFGADPLETPVVSGAQFTSSTNLFASRDHFRQQVIDIAQLVRVLADTTSGIGAIDVDDPATAGVTERLDPLNPGYMGQSLGGIIGTLVAAGDSRLGVERPGRVDDRRHPHLAGVQLEQGRARHLPHHLEQAARLTGLRAVPRHRPLGARPGRPAKLRPAPHRRAAARRLAAQAHLHLLDRRRRGGAEPHHPAPPQQHRERAGPRELQGEDVPRRRSRLPLERLHPGVGAAGHRGTERRHGLGEPVSPRALLLAALLLARGVLAAGFALPEQSARSLGTAGTGTGSADGASAIYYDPALLAFEDGISAEVSGTLIAPSFSWEPLTVAGGSGVPARARLFAQPALFLAAPVAEGVFVGVGGFSNFGLGISWPSSFPGRFDSSSAAITTFTVNPSAAYRIDRHLAVGAGVDVVRASVELEQGLDFIDQEGALRLGGGTWGVGFNAGLAGRWLSDRLTVGLAYRSFVGLAFKGRADFSAPPEFASTLQDQDVETRLTLPNLLSLGAGYRVTPRFRVMADLTYTTWSSLKVLPITFPGDPSLSQELRRDWQNTLTVRAGAEAQLTRTIAARLGAGYDPSPSPADTLSPSLPDSSRILASAGAGYRAGNLSADLGYMLV